MSQKEATLMKIVGFIGAVVLMLSAGTAPAKSAQQGQQQEANSPKQGDQAKPEKQQQDEQKQPDQHKQQQDQSKQQQKQQQDQNKQQQQNAHQMQQKQQQDQNKQQAQKQDRRPSPQGKDKQREVWQPHRAQNWQSEHRDWHQRGGYNGYRIPDDRYRGHFGPSHVFRIYRYPVEVYGGYPRFQFGGFWFGFMDPWPEYWADDWYDNDDVYIVYSDDGYYLYNRRYPEDRIAVAVYAN
jgi:flagellar motor protein MotB